MHQLIQRLLGPPELENQEKTDRAGFLFALLHTVLLATVLLPLVMAVLPSVVPFNRILFTSLIGQVVILALMEVARRGRVRLAGGLLALFILTVVTLTDLRFYGVRDPATNGYFLVIIIASLILGGKPGLAFAALCCLALLDVFLAERAGWTLLVQERTDTLHLAFYWVVFLLVGLLLRQATHSLEDALRRSQQNSKDLAEKNRILAEREAQLLESETRLQAIFDHSQDAIGVSRSDMHVLVNRAYLDMFGYQSMEECIGLSPLELIAPGERAQLFAQVEAGLRGEPAPSCFVTRGLRKDGTEFDLDGRISYYELDGERYAVVILRDITHYLQVEQELRYSENRYRLLFENNPLPMWVCDLDTQVFLAVNQAAVHAYGYSLEEFLHMTMADLYAPGEAVTSPETGACTGIWAHRTKDGHWIDVELVSHLLDFSGQPAWLVLANDVTERNLALAELDLERIFLREVIDAVPGFIFVKDSIGQYALANRALAQAYCTTVEDMLDKTDSDFYFDASEVERFLAEDRWVIDNRRTLEIPEEKFVYRDGSVHWQSMVKVPLADEAGQCSRVLGVATDITARKQAEDEVLRLNQELEQRVQDRTAQLEQALRELEAFSYTVSHDLRAPLRAMDGYSRLLLEDLGPQLSGDALEMLQNVRLSAQKMGQLIDDLLAFSRLGRQPLHRRAVDCNELVCSVLADLAGDLAGRTVELSVADLPGCQGDPSLLRQVWMNLLANAVKFTRQAAVARIEVSYQSGSAGETVYSVRDNGVGFDMRYATKLFAVFQRLHGPDDFEGTGVGLAIVERIVTRHGGRVWADAAPGQGATFYFTVDDLAAEPVERAGD